MLPSCRHCLAILQYVCICTTTPISYIIIRTSLGLKAPMVQALPATCTTCPWSVSALTRRCTMLYLLLMPHAADRVIEGRTPFTPAIRLRSPLNCDPGSHPPSEKGGFVTAPAWRTRVPEAWTLLIHTARRIHHVQIPVARSTEGGLPRF
jgi:hypothetical protein